MNHALKRPLILFVLFFSRVLKGAEKPDDAFLAKIEKIDALLSQIDSDKLFNFFITREKAKLINDLMRYNENDQSTQGKENEAHFFEPKQPAPLSEKDKKIPIHERISKKYIGQLPGRINDLIFYFSNQELCLKNRVDIYNRILLHGQPGTGKSHLVKILAEELQIPYLYFSASFFADKYIGETSRKIRKAFTVAKSLNKPILIFIDEIDALATKRKDNTHNEHRSSLITLLTEMQDLQSNKNVFVIVATNDLNALDPAIKDRFAGSICEIKALTIDERAELFKKTFAERGEIIEENFAKRLAEVTNTTTYDKEAKTNLANFSNRDIESITSTILLRRFAECQKDKNNCNKHLCNYARKVIDETGKKASFSRFGIKHEYCEGI